MSGVTIVSGEYVKADIPDSLVEQVKEFVETIAGGDFPTYPEVLREFDDKGNIATIGIVFVPE